MVGNGAYSDRLYYGQVAARLRNGDVGVATDTGHEGGDLKFGAGHPERIVDWGHRAVHESVVAAKTITASFYGAGPRLSYFSGCSTAAIKRCRKRSAIRPTSTASSRVIPATTARI